MCVLAIPRNHTCEKGYKKTIHKCLKLERSIATGNTTLPQICYGSQVSFVNNSFFGYCLVMTQGLGMWFTYYIINPFDAILLLAIIFWAAVLLSYSTSQSTNKIFIYRWVWNIKYYMHKIVSSDLEIVLVTFNRRVL